MTFSDGVEAKAKVVGTDKRSDVAVIKVDNTSYPPLPKGDSSKLKVGELVMAVGSPFELSQSVTTGIISALERNAVGINEYESFIQTDAPINRGNSGGPLVNMNGEVIGINSAIVSGSSGNDGIGFAIPINMAASVANMLIKDGKVHYARIGIQLCAADPGTRPPARPRRGDQGRAGRRCPPRQPGRQGGPQAGRRHHRLRRREGSAISRRSGSRWPPARSPSRTRWFHSRRQGANDVDRPGAGRESRLRNGERRRAEHRQPKASEPDKTTINGFGLEVQPLTAELAKPLGLPADLKGLVVSSVKDGSPAEAAGIQEGDVITKVVRDHKPSP